MRDSKEAKRLRDGAPPHSPVHGGGLTPFTCGSARRPLLEFLQLLSDELAGEGQVSALALYAFLALLAEHEMQELAHFRIHRLARVATQIEENVVRQWIALVANRLDRALDVGPAVVGLDREVLEVRRERQRGGIEHGIAVARHRSLHL